MRNMSTKVFWGIAFAFIVGLVACDSDEGKNDTEPLPAAVKQDFEQRYGAAVVTSFHTLAFGIQELNFTDKENDRASAFYENGRWKLSVTQLDDKVHLPAEVRNSFENSPYAQAHIEAMERIERIELSHALYRFCFKFPLHHTPDMTHEVFMNEDGILLHTFHYTLVDPRWFVSLEEEQLNFIKEHYPQADIRAYHYVLGCDTYFFMQDGTLKQIAFRNDNQWKETCYELPADTALPPHITDWLRKNDPAFRYTQVNYIESPSGHAYWLVNKEADDEKGYILGEQDEEELIPVSPV